MADLDRYRPAADFVDPRFQPGFIPELLPLCNGQPAPLSGDPDLHEQRCLEFLAAYYRINLLVLRRGQPPLSPAENEVPQITPQHIAQAIRALENLEDRYAPIGFYGEPITSADGIHRDVHFVRPGLNPSPSAASSRGSHFMIPGLDDLPSSELQGPIQVTRWRYGKVDL